MIDIGRPIINDDMKIEAAKKVAEKIDGASDLSDLVCTNDIIALLDRIVPRIDAGGPNPIDEKLHHCEYTLYRERERIHAEFRDHFRDAKKMVHEHSFSPSLLDGGGTLVCACGAWK